MENCVHHFILQGSHPAAPSVCKKCGLEKEFTGGWTYDDKPIIRGKPNMGYWQKGENRVT